MNVPPSGRSSSALSATRSRSSAYGAMLSGTNARGSGRPWYHPRVREEERGRELGRVQHVARAGPRPRSGSSSAASTHSVVVAKLSTGVLHVSRTADRQLQLSSSAAPARRARESAAAGAAAHRAAGARAARSTSANDGRHAEARRERQPRRRERAGHRHERQQPRRAAESAGCLRSSRVEPAPAEAQQRCQARDREQTRSPRGRSASPAARRQSQGGISSSFQDLLAPRRTLVPLLRRAR